MGAVTPQIWTLPGTGIKGCPAGYSGLGLSQWDQKATVPVHAPLLVAGPGRFQRKRSNHGAADWR